jgi:hypothetical protein
MQAISSALASALFSGLEKGIVGRSFDRDPEGGTAGKRVLPTQGEKEGGVSVGPGPDFVPPSVASAFRQLELETPPRAMLRRGLATPSPSTAPQYCGVHKNAERRVCSLVSQGSKLLLGLSYRPPVEWVGLNDTADALAGACSEGSYLQIDDIDDIIHLLSGEMVGGMYHQGRWVKSLRTKDTLIISLGRDWLYPSSRVAQNSPRRAVAYALRVLSEVKQLVLFETVTWSRDYTAEMLAGFQDSDNWPYRNLISRFPTLFEQGELFPQVPPSTKYWLDWKS